MKLKLASRVFLVVHNPDGLLIDSKSINKGIATVKLLLQKIIIFRSLKRGISVAATLQLQSPLTNSKQKPGGGTRGI